MQSESLRILIIEDQIDIAASIWDYLEKRSYTVDHANDGKQGLVRAMQGSFDIIVLDLGLPRLDGLDLCRQLRSAGHSTPVLMLTARDTLEDKLRGFANGADDYMVKPFLMAELEARIQVLYRRGRPLHGSTLVCGNLSYHRLSMQAMREGRCFTLSKSQAKLLELLIHQSPNIVSHQKMMHEIWGDSDGDVASLHSHIYALRVMIDKPFARPMIHSVHGVGYRISENSDSKE